MSVIFISLNLTCMTNGYKILNTIIFCRPLPPLSFIIITATHPAPEMSSKVIAVTTFVVLITVALNSAAPAQYPQSPVPYNLHNAFTAEDINQLSTKSRSNIARTIAEVEKVLASDPKLPRLTR